MAENNPTLDNAPSFAIRGQYVKDISFENPNAPQSLLSNNTPKIEVSVELKAQNLQNDIYETIIFISVRATDNGSAIYHVDLAYAGLFEVANVPPEHVEPMVMIDCPFVLFPFARRIVSDLTRDGGFSPLLLDPIDFQALYMKSKARY